MTAAWVWIVHRWWSHNWAWMAKEMLKKSYPVSCICHLSRNASDSFSNPTTTIFLYPFNMMDRRFGACWNLLHDVEHLHFPVKRARILKIGVLGPFQSKMEVLQGKGKMPASLAVHILLRSSPRTCSNLWLFKLHLWLASGRETWRSREEKRFYGRLSEWKTWLRV